MHLSIRHETVYRYSEPQAYSIEQLHLMPRREPQQQALSWHITMPGHAEAYSDAYGNVSHMLTINEPHDTVRILVEGLVHTTALPGGRLQGSETLSPLIFTVPTRLTQPTPLLADVAGQCLPPPGSCVGTADLLRLAAHVHGAVAYQSGATDVFSTAGDAMLAGAGVCQDHAHIFLACCHARGIPARYVSGYVDPGSTGHAASHAWIDAWAEDDDFSGWVAIDVTHHRLMTDAYCRLAIGRDYESAAPVRGSRRGGGEETLHVEAVIVPVQLPLYNERFSQQQ